MKKSVYGEFKNGGGDFGMMLILGPEAYVLNKWLEANLDQPPASEPRPGQHVVRRMHLIAVDAVIRWRRVGDNPVLGSAIEAAPQVISAKTRS